MNLQINGLVLPNGMPVVIVQDPSASEIDVVTRYRVGSVDDPADHPGMAHLVEHLMFQQTLGAKSLFAHLEDDATEFNGETTFDATTYMERAPLATLDEMLSIEAVRVGFRCTTVSEAVFEREREVVANEMLQRGEARGAGAALYQAAYPPDHPYHRYGADSADSIRAITRDQACAFADAHYGPANGVLVVSGNLTTGTVIASLKKFLAHVAKHAVVAPAPVVALTDAPRHVEVTAPIDDLAVMISWPLPGDPKERAEVQAIARIAAGAIDASVKGRVVTQQLGDPRAPVFAVIIEITDGETPEQVITTATNALDEISADLAHPRVMSFDEMSFDQMQQTAIYTTYASLEDPTERDTQLAADVLAGHDPEQQLASTFEGLRALTPEEASRIAHAHLTIDHATVATLTPADKKTGHTLSVAAAIHDLGQRRDPANPAEAHEPVPAGPVAPSEVRTRTLPNGLRVVLMPLTSVPTVDIRLVFGTGTADEPVAMRGVALVAGYALTWSFRYLNDWIGFMAAGGIEGVEVTPDVTTFNVRGVDMHLDLMLAGLRRWVRDGVYTDSSESLLDVLRAQAKRTTDTGALTDAWREAMFGAGHPYVEAGLVRHISRAVTIDDAEKFRAAHYTPDNATLVIAGHFDAALADKWIDFLFADWQGHAEPRAARHGTPTPASLGAIDDTAQVQLAFSIPATAGSRGAQLVAAAMLNQIADDVRQQLGASYGVSALLDDQRLASEYLVGGSVAATRTADAMQLLRDRIAALHSNPDLAASTFVAARQHVLAQLASVAETSVGLATNVEHEVSVGGNEETDAQTAADVRALTIDALGPTLADLDLAKAAVMIRGPQDDVDKGFAALGRTPRMVAIDKDVVAKAELPEPSEHHHRSESVKHLERALTEQASKPALTLTAGVGYGASQLVEPDETVVYHCCSGAMLIAEIGYRYDPKHAVGLHLGFGSLSGNEGDGFALIPMSAKAYDIDAFAQASGYDRLWGAAFIGAHIDDVTIDDGKYLSGTGIGIGLEGGVDVVHVNQHRIGAFLRVDGTLMTASGYASATLGLAYRL
jgi:zinc protease